MQMTVVKRTENQFDAEHSTFMQELNEVLDMQKKISPGDIYIIVVPRVEEFPQKVFKKRFIPRETCPYPHFSQTVFRWNRADDNLELLWTLPEKEFCEELRDDALFVAPEWKENLNYVIDYYDGTLTKRADELNKTNKLRHDLVLRSYSDAQMTHKEKHKKMMDELSKSRSHKKIY